MSLEPSLSNDPLEIKPTKVALSHQQRATRPRSQSRSSFSTVAIIGLIVLVGGALLLLASQLLGPNQDSEPKETIAGPTQSADKDQQTTSTGKSSSPAAAANDANELPPFAATQRQLAKEKAQAQLSQFVESQLKLQEQMQVGAWGQVEYDAALDLANLGDEQFVADNFAEALTHYADAVTALQAVMDRGAALLADALKVGEQALVDRNKNAAEEQFQLALTIDPNNSTAQAGLARAVKLPQVISLLRDARNEELSGQWRKALDIYAEVQSIDPKTADLAQQIDHAEDKLSLANLQKHLSEGFAAIDSRNYQRARQAFNRALKIDNGNDMALSGLQQVSEKTELSQIDRLLAQATSSEATEDWSAAVSTYDKLISIDKNLQPARQGLTRAKHQRRLMQVLGRILAQPEKLSSEKLLEEGKNILLEAQAAQPIGPKLEQRILAVDKVLRVYSEPITVTLRSDAQTEVMLSTVGELGTFETKQLALRPGAYTLIGSRVGCRDTRLQVVVAAGMGPVDIRCQEAIK